MTNDSLMKLVEKRETIVIVGVADVGSYLFRFLKDNRKAEAGQKIVLCDNSRKKQGHFGEYDVTSVEEAALLFPQALYLITSKFYENVMRAQLVGYGISHENIILGVTEEAGVVWAERKKALQPQKLQPLEKLHFEVDIAGHCNLNCKCCSQFSSISDEEFVDVDGMRRDFERLGRLFGGEAEYIFLIGGEPLLYPGIARCMEIARENFPIGKISVYTNGLLLLKQDEEFWSACRKNEISIIVTKYPIPLDHKRMVEKAESEGVAFEFWGTSEDFKYMGNLGLDVEGGQDIQKSFVNCVEANRCIKLRDGKLFTCTRPAAIYKFNRFFGKNLEVSEGDYIDIYKAKDKEEILEKLAQPIPFCRYCNVLGERKAMEWGRTEGKIEEWT